MDNQTGGPEPPGKKSTQETWQETMADQSVSTPTYDLNNRYSCTDNGPFFVYVEHINKNVGRLFPIRVGHYLFNNSDFKNDIMDIKSVGINRVKVIFKSYTVANRLINHDLIINNNLVAYIPKFYTHKKGVVKMVDTFFEEDYLKDAIQSNVRVVEVRRMKRRVTNADGTTNLVPRQIIIVTFLGNSLPSNIQINLVNFAVEPYIYPVVQCYKCFRYGHTLKLCKSNAKCKNCAKVYDTDHNCEKENPYCFHCKTEGHISTSKKCPYYIKQQNIKKIMASENVNFIEAEKILNNPSYAKITVNNRFSLLNNLNNYPELPPSSNKSNTIQPIIRRPSTQPTPKKRKARSPVRPTSPLPIKNPATKKSQPIIPNPYRDEFVQYREKLISGISLFISEMINNPEFHKNNYRNSDIVESTVRRHIINIIGEPSESHNHSDDSTY